MNPELKNEVGMELVEFYADVKEQENKSFLRKNPDSNISGITGFIIKRSEGFIKNKKQAEYILVTVAVLFFTISTYLLWDSIGPQKKFSLPEEFIRGGEKYKNR